MKQLRLLPVIVAVCAGLLAGCQKAEGQSSVATVDLTTPESAVTAYITGIKQQDFDGIIAATATGKMSEGFDFVAFVGRLRTLALHTPAPSNAPLFIAVNEADFTAQIARKVKVLVYGLMTTSEVVQDRMIPMKGDGAKDFMSVVNADRLKGLELVKVGIPNPTLQNSEVNQRNRNELAKIYGADTITERVALVSFEGLHFVVGFSVIRYGDEWRVYSQDSPLANLVGPPQRITPEEFETMLK